MSRRPLIALVALIALLTATAVAVAGTTKAGDSARDRAGDRPHSGVPDGFVPAAVRAQQNLGRYFVVVDGPSVASRAQASGRAQTQAARSARRPYPSARERGGRHDRWRGRDPGRIGAERRLEHRPERRVKLGLGHRP